MFAVALETTDDLVMRSGQCTLLANVLLMTKNMLELAHSGEWDSVAELEVDRRQLLADTFESPVPSEHSEIFSEALAGLLHMNEELMALVKSAKDDVTHQHAAQVRKREGIGHYLDVEEQR